ncbi:MAG: hypothetical protein EAZ89_16020 [Bacteroidetes bacterium]|nr:MAG: hypothetical protein EAZ89_16020 [Bacteroidota bacterium]
MGSFVRVFVLCMTLLLACAACAPEPPAEAALRARFKGLYCGGNYTLELGDSTYFVRKRLKGALGTYTATESCSGTYQLHFQAGTWKIRYAADPQPRTVFETCEFESTLWTPQDPAWTPEDTIRLAEPFDGNVLRKNACP